MFLLFLLFRFWFWFGSFVYFVLFGFVFLILTSLFQVKQGGRRLLKFPITVTEPGLAKFQVN